MICVYVTCKLDVYYKNYSSQIYRQIHVHKTAFYVVIKIMLCACQGWDLIIKIINY